MEIAAIWRAFVDAAGPTAVAALWQGTALALGLSLCLRLVPRISAADRFRVWAAGFAALAALPFLPGALAFFHSVFYGAGSAVPSTSLASPGSAAGHPWVAHPWFDLDARWSLAIAAVWLTASITRAVDLGVHTVRLRRLWKRAVPIAAGDAVNLPHQLDKRVEVCTTRDLDRPAVIGFFAPRILIPEWLLERLTAGELEQVVLHEAEHLRRRDDWLNLAQKLCLVLFPLNPGLAWMEHRLCREREMACDEGVVRRTQAPRAYAACLASLAERGLQHRAEALSLGAWQRRPELVNRVHRILRRGPGLHPAAARAVLGVVGCGLVLGSVELARCPQVVAFAARPAEPTIAETHADADVVPMARYRAVNAVAHVPSRAELAAGRDVQRRIGARVNRAKASHTRSIANSIRSARNDRADQPASTVAAAEKLEAAQPQAASADSSTGQPQQWVVFTAWEQVESAGPAASPAAEQAGSALQSVAAPQVIREYTVTRVFMRVYPAGAGATQSRTGRHGATGNKISITPLPAAIPIRDGWLVLQL